MSESDVESDDELQVTLAYFGDELVNRPHHNGVQRIDWSHQRGLVLGLLTTQIASGRVDWVESILLLVMRFHQEESSCQALVDDVIYHAMSHAASRGTSVQFGKLICRITAG